jgi:hypothetical protein
MRKTTVILALTSAWLVTAGGSASAQTPGAAQMLAIKPKLDDIAITTPTAEELSHCKVEDVVEGGKKIGYVLLDSKKQTLRRYVAGKEATQINLWSFYKDGVEVFRQIDSNLDGKVDQYRWLGTAGLKWGIDRNQDGKIDAWHMISAEEVGHELFLALATSDFERLKALTISPAEIQQLGLPEAAAAKMSQAVQGIQAKFQQAFAKQPNLKNAAFLRVEGGAPGCWTADAIGASKDLIKFASRSVLYETADKKHDWFQTGEMVQVGVAWRLVDVVSEQPIEDTRPDNPQLNKLLVDLGELEKKIGEQPNQNPGKPHAVLAGLYEQRAALTGEIVKLVTVPAERETWYKQMLDSLASSAVAGSENAKKTLAHHRQQLVGSAPGGNLTGYAVYREVWAKYAADIVKGDTKAQEAYNEELAKFAKDYPRADDTPDALHQLGMGCEFSTTKEKDEEAARWYRAIYTNFPEHHLAEWAKGAERRLKLTGNPLELKGTTLTNQPFNINQVKESVAIVCYWASNCTTCPADFARLKQVLSTQKGVELICVNLDAKAQDAAAFLQQHSIQAMHVIQAATDQNGLRGSLATYYGVNVLPTIFLVGRDGRVINPKLQLADLEESLKKAIAP